MFESVFDVDIIKDLVPSIKKDIEDLSRKEILVGIPDSVKHKDSDLSNAQLLFLHTNGVRQASMRSEMQKTMNDGKTYSQAHEMYIYEHGSPAFSIPPRPVLIPAMENSKERIAEKMKQCMQDVLDGHNPSTRLERIALFCENKAKDWFTDPSNEWPPNSPKTIAKKHSSNPLIDTGELRKSIRGLVGDKR